MRITEDKMPSVQGGVQQGGLLSVRANSDNMGGMLSSGIRAVEKNASDIIDRNDAYHAKELENRVNEESATIMRDLESKKGKEGMAAADQVQDRLREVRKRIYADSGAADRVTNRVELIAQADEAFHVDRAQRYKAQENERWLDDVSAATLKTSYDRAVNDHTNSEALGVSLDDNRQELEEFGARKGWPKEKVEQMISQANGLMFKDIIGKYIENGDFTKARGFYETPGVKESLVEHQGRIEGMLNQGEKYQRIQRISDAVYSEDKTLEQMRKDVNESKDVKDEDKQAIMGELLNRHNVAIGDRNRLLDQKYQSLADQVWKGAKLSDLNQADLISLDINQQEHLKNLQDSTINGGSVKTQPLEYSDLLSRLYAGDIQDEKEFAKYAPTVSRGQLDSAIKIWHARGEIKPNLIEQSFRRALNIKGKGLDDKQHAELGAFGEYVNKNIGENHRPEDLQSLADQWVMEGKPREPSWFGIGDPKTYGQAVTAGKEKDFLIKTPDQERDAIIGAQTIIGDRSNADEFNTRYGLKARRWLSANKMPAEPEAIAAVAAVDKVGLPTTRDTVAGSSWILQNVGPKALNRYTIKAAAELKNQGLKRTPETLFQAAKIIEAQEKKQQ